jgi:hypothetical protein
VERRGYASSEKVSLANSKTLLKKEAWKLVGSRMRDWTILLVHVVTHQLRILSRSRRQAIDQGTYGRYLVQ